MKFIKWRHTLHTKEGLVPLSSRQGRSPYDPTRSYFGERVEGVEYLLVPGKGWVFHTYTDLISRGPFVQCPRCGIATFWKGALYGRYCSHECSRAHP